MLTAYHVWHLWHLVVPVSVPSGRSNGLGGGARYWDIDSDMDGATALFFSNDHHEDTSPLAVVS
jgi:hypothetical protein